MSLPAWLARSIYRAQEAAMHRPTFAMLAEIERTQWLSPRRDRGGSGSAIESAAGGSVGA